MAEKDEKMETGIVDPQLDQFVKEIRDKPVEWRKKFYEDCSKYALIRYFNENNPNEKKGIFDEIETIRYIEGPNGIGFILRFRGMNWGVFLDREEKCAKAIEEAPQLRNEPEMYVMDLRKAAIGCMTQWHVEKVN